MTSKMEFSCIATCIGSMPHQDTTAACALIGKYLPDLPFWPQLPRRSLWENMYVQFSEGFPGIIAENGKITVGRSDQFDKALEKLYSDYAENILEDYRISAKYAAGLYAFKNNQNQTPKIVKGQITGPISMGLSIVDEQGRGIIYDELLAETIAKFLHLKMAWQQKFLRGISENTIIFVDEPYLASLGSAFVAISVDHVSGLIEDVISGIQGLKGIHCCGGTDWSLLLKSSTDILSFDTYNYADSFSCYPADVKAFLERGGTIAWGIVPNDEDWLRKETPASLMDRLGEAIAPHSRDGISFRQVLAQSIVTPSCALTSLSVEACAEALKLLSDLSSKIRTKYF